MKDNAKEEYEAGNVEASKKKLGVAKSQVESFASMVKITRRISPKDKASFLAESTKIIGKIDELINKFPCCGIFFEEREQNICINSNFKKV